MILLLQSTVAANLSCSLLVLTAIIRITRDRKKQNHQAQNDCDRNPYMPQQVLLRSHSIARAQKPLEKEQTSSPDERSYYKRHERHLQQTLRQHEGLERNWKRSHRRNQDRHQGMLFYPGM